MRPSIRGIWIPLAFVACSEPTAPNGLVEELSRLAFVAGEEGSSLLADRFEVTNGEYARFLRETGYRGASGPAFLYHWDRSGGSLNPPSDKEDHPVDFVSREDAEAYCRWAGKRLPTEDEWERLACGQSGPSFRTEVLGVSRVQYPWGSHWAPLLCNSSELGLGRTAPVGTFESGRSAFGCFDAAGNVWEWVIPKVRRVREDPESGSVLVEESLELQAGLAKGGAFDYSKEKSQCYERLEINLRSRAHDLGFRGVAEFDRFMAPKLAGFRPEKEERSKLLRIASQWGPESMESWAALERASGVDPTLLRELRDAALGR